MEIRTSSPNGDSSFNNIDCLEGQSIICALMEIRIASPNGGSSFNNIDCLEGQSIICALMEIRIASPNGGSSFNNIDCLEGQSIICALMEIRTPVLGLKGLPQDKMTKRALFAVALSDSCGATFSISVD
jgi:hypothetical protein